MRYLLTIACLLLFAALCCGCTTNDQNTSNTLPKDKYVAIYEEYNNSSTLIGNTSYTPGNPWPMPGVVLPFDYHNSSGRLIYSWYDGCTVNDSFKILYGKMSYIDNPVAYGFDGTFVNGIYELPVSPEIGLTIVNVTRDGTIIATCNNNSFSLKPGENWTSTLITGTALGQYYTLDLPLPNQDGTIPYISWPVNYTISIKITNMGIYSKSLLNNSYGH